MKRFAWLPIANIVAYVITLIINGVSQVPGLFPQTIKELGESRAIFFLPAGFVFSIWGVIYLGLGAYVIYLARPSQRENPLTAKISYWFILSCIANSVWLILFLNNLVAESTLAMLVLLVALLAIYLRVGIGREAVSNTVRWCVHIPFSIYLGWITVATVANISAMLYVQGSVVSFVGINADIWAVVMMAVAAIVALAMIITRRDVAFALVVAFALFGIYARPFNTAVFSPLQALNVGLVTATSLAIALVIAVAVVGRIALSQMRPAPKTAL